jgi:DNA-binding transcriptional MerR regulator
MRTLKTSEAAALLNVSANTLRRWECRFGYPRPRRSPGRHRLYAYAEITALRAALEEGLSISSAVSVVGDVFNADGNTIVTALAAFRGDQADLAIEMSLGLRSLERTIEHVLLPALAEIQRRKGTHSTIWAFAARWAADWLSRAQRLTPVASDAPGLLIGDATEGALDVAHLYARSLELCCTRAGAAVLTLPVCALGRLSEPIAALDPATVLIAGGYASDDTVARWAYAVRQAAGDVPFLLYHRQSQDGFNGSRPRVLASSPVEAGKAILHLLRSTLGNAPNADAATPPIPAS